jgi:hypothetical protein
LGREADIAPMAAFAKRIRLQKGPCKREHDFQLLFGQSLPRPCGLHEAVGNDLGESVPLSRNFLITA